MNFCIQKFVNDSLCVIIHPITERRLAPYLSAFHLNLSDEIELKKLIVGIEIKRKHKEKWRLPPPPPKTK